MSTNLTLISHAICPFVQRAAIVMLEKDVPFERKDIDLKNKPDWFLAISPLGKTPLLMVGESPIFESAVICEYLDETRGERIHPEDPLRRARHRGWVEFASSVFLSVMGFYTSRDDASLQGAARECRVRFEQLENAVGEAPFFDGEFSMVDAAFAPIFRFFDTFDEIDDFGMLTGLPKITAWRQALAERPSVKAAVRPDYADLFKAYLKAKDSALASRI